MLPSASSFRQHSARNRSALAHERGGHGGTRRAPEGRPGGEHGLRRIQAHRRGVPHREERLRQARAAPVGVVDGRDGLEHLVRSAGAREHVLHEEREGAAIGGELPIVVPAGGRADRAHRRAAEPREHGRAIPAEEHGTGPECAVRHPGDVQRVDGQGDRRERRDGLAEREHGRPGRTATLEHRGERRAGHALDERAGPSVVHVDVEQPEGMGMPHALERRELALDVGQRGARPVGLGRDIRIPRREHLSARSPAEQSHELGSERRGGGAIEECGCGDRNRRHARTLRLAAARCEPPHGDPWTTGHPRPGGGAPSTPPPGSA